MDVRLPDGTVITNVPDNITQSELMARVGSLQKQRATSQVNSDAITQGARNFADEMSGPQKFLAGIGSGMNSVKQALTFAPKAEVEETKRLDAPLQNTGAGFAGNIAGNIAATAPAMFIPGANTILGAGAIGAGVGALTTPGDMQDRATGAAFGSAGGMAGQAIPRVFSAAKAAAEPLTEKGRAAIIGRVMNRAAGDNAGAVTQRLNSAAPLVPGSMPTAAEVAESGGIAALQRAMSAADPEAYTHRGMEQASARINALRGIAGDDGQREMFKASRDTAAKQLYNDAYKAGIDLRRDAATGQFLNKSQQAGRKGEINKLMSAPAMQEAAKRARVLMSNELEKVGDPAGSVKGLDYTRRALSDMIGEAEKGSNQERVLTALKSRLDTTLDTISPKYAEARATFAEMSKPVNQMDVGRNLLEKLQPALVDHGALAKETGAKFAQALRDEGGRVVKESTGMRRGLEDVMTPEQLSTIQSVAKDLARKANAQDLGRGVGSNTFQNFAMDNLAQQGGMPSAVRSTLGAIPGLSPTMTLLSKGAGALGNMAYKNSDEAMRQAMAKALLDPKASAALMESAGKPSALVKMLQKLPQDKLPADDVLRLLQAMPGIAGTATLPAYLEK